jgi:hypothetical protein
MIIPGDIKENDFVLVLVEEDSESLAKVIFNKGEYLIVSYLCQSGKVYKGTKVFSFETLTEFVEFDSLVEHYIDVTDLKELGFVKVHENMFVEKEDIDEDSLNEIETDESETESDTEMNDFIVPDDEEILIKPVDHREVDSKWDTWKPRTSGAKRFKEKIDMIEAYMKSQIDEKFVF